MELTTITLTIACALLCVVLTMCVTWHRRRQHFYKEALKFDGPPVLPLIGNAHLFAGSTEAILRTVFDLTKSYPSPFRLWMGPQLLIFVTDPEQVKTILVSPKIVDKSTIYNFFRPIVGEGLMTAPASKWREHRKLIQPTFNAKILNSFVKKFSARSRILVSNLERKLNGPEFEILHFLSLSTIHMLCDTVMGVEIETETSTSTINYIEALQRTGDAISTRIASIWLHPEFIFNRTQCGKDHWRGVSIIHDFTNGVIQRQKTEHQLKRSMQPDEDDECKYKPRREAFIDFLLNLSSRGDEKWSDEDVRDEVITMMIAGEDSTSITNSFVMLMLATHPDVQENVYRELHEIYGSEDIDDREVTHEDLARMDYLERVIKETMRLFPLFALVSRMVRDDFDIGGHTLPKGSDVFIPAVAVHRNEKYWPDPLKFDPDRFLPEEVARRHPYSYLPFSAGPRNCIGFKWAMMAMKTVQAMVLRRYILKKDNVIPVKDIRLKLEPGLKTVDPIKIRLERR